MRSFPALADIFPKYIAHQPLPWTLAAGVEKEGGEGRLSRKDDTTHTHIEELSLTTDHSAFAEKETQRTITHRPRNMHTFILTYVHALYGDL